MSTNASAKFIIGHVNHNPAYTYKFQLINHQHYHKSSLILFCVLNNSIISTEEFSVGYDLVIKHKMHEEKEFE